MNRRVRIGLCVSALPIGGYLLLGLLVVPVYPHFVSPNEFSRWATTASIVETGSPEVSWLLPLLGSGLEDLAQVGDRVYSNKAPAGAVLAIPAYVAGRMVLGEPSVENLRASLYLCRILFATIPALLTAGVFGTIAVVTRARPQPFALGLLGLLFGTPLFAYGLLFFSHAFSAFCLLAIWSLLYLPGLSEWRWSPLISGALGGLAVTSEYTTAVPLAVLVIGLMTSRRWADTLITMSGGLPFAILLSVYQKTLFGSYFAVSSGNERFAEFRELASSGLFGIGMPSFTNLVSILFDPSRGLLVFSPFLVIGLLSLPRVYRELPRPAFMTLVLAPLSLLLLISGYPNWHGGWTVGMRYLVPVIPLMVVPFLYSRPGWGSSALIGASVLATTATTLGFPFVPNDLPWPWLTLSADLFGRGLRAPVWSDLVVPSLFGSLLVVAVIVLVAFGTARRRPRHILSVCLGVGAAIVIPIALTDGLNPVQRLQNAYLRQTYFDQPAAMALEFPSTPLPPRLVERYKRERRLPPESWPGYAPGPDTKSDAPQAE